MADQGAHEDPIALPYYEKMADAYAAATENKPHNAFYDRPALLSLLPPLEGRTVLDAGCGYGWYAEVLVEHGARVTAIDVSPRMVALARARLAGRAEVRCANLGQPLDFLGDATYDLVVSGLTMHYLKAWTPVLREFHRVLVPGGLLVFSTHHPFRDYQRYEVDSYFGTQLLEDEWEGAVVRFYRRPLTVMFDALAEAGFVVERLLEPLPTEDFRRADPKGYARLMREPSFLAIRARREGNEEQEEDCCGHR